MYLITIQNLFNAYNEKWKKKPSCHIACKDGQFDVVELMMNNQFNLNIWMLNNQHDNGMTPFDLPTVCSFINIYYTTNNGNIKDRTKPLTGSLLH